MLVPPVPAEEQRRLALLAACRILYTPAEQAFDEVAQLAAELCGAEIALITLVDSDYQWFKAKVGVAHVGTPRDLSFCGHCIVGRQPFVVEDTLRDPRFADNPLVTGDPYVRSYTGVPLLVDGLAVGALSVADRRPRKLDERQLHSLVRLANRIASELQLRHDLARAGADEPAPAGDVGIAPGTVVGGRWLVARELGRGGVGAVFEASDTAGTRVAVKVLLPKWANERALLDRFAREARLLMKLRSPHVAQLYDVGNLGAAQGGLPYLVLELLEGTDLGQMLEESARVPYREAVAWCADACEGVAAAHELGIIHRDLKPSNIFLARTGGDGPVVKVIDFGIARETGTAESMRVTSADEVVGSPWYMSPEQMIGVPDLDARTDVWSMGAALYELIGGAPPFTGATPFEIFAAAAKRPLVPLRAHVADVPPAVQTVLSKCLNKDRGQRFSSMRELATALRAIA